MNSVQFIGSGKPFGTTAKEYRLKGWLGIMPLAAKTKHPPPVGYTGRGGKFADDDTVDEWINDPKNAKGNIAIHLGFDVIRDEETYEIIGLDVDHHPDDKEDPKYGWDQLQVLEKKYGKLPPTYTSSSRNDGRSGIRFFLVPKGYAFRGNCGEHGPHIDIIQRVHRYAVVYPSFHPKGGQYLWYPPGTETKGIYEQEIPWTHELPLLPEKWLNFLTRGGLTDSEGFGIDLDISATDIWDWAKTNFPPPLEGASGGMCEAMRKKVIFWRDKIDNSSESHYQIVAAHWNTLLWAAEGHHGWQRAIKIIERHYIRNCLERNKRELTEVKKEVFRSRINALRKVKAKVDSYAQQGLNYLGSCSCKKTKGSFSAPQFTVVRGSNDPGGSATGASGASEDDEISAWARRIPHHEVPLNKKYEKNDDGNAACMYDHYQGNVHYLTNWGKWLIWDGKTWTIDDFGLIKALFRCVVVDYYRKKEAFMVKKMEEYLKQAGNGADDARYKRMEADRVALNKWILQCGNLTRSDSAVKVLRSFPKISKKYEELNANPLLLQTAGDAVIELTEPTRFNPAARKTNERVRGYRVLPSDKSFYITHSTAASYRKFKDQDGTAVEIFNNYLDTFLPDKDYRRFVRKALGHTIIGGNPERLAIFLQGPTSTGKSTILTALQKTLGTYAGPFNPNNVFKEKASGLNPELANHLQRRVICASEAGSQQIHANIFKRITGKEPVTVERKNVNEIIEAIPQFVPVVATNASPTINGEDEALRKRIMVLPFDIQITEAADDKRMDVILAEQGKDIIFYWLLQGYTDYVNEGLDYSEWHPWVKARTLEFNSELSNLGEFLHECCDVISREEREMFSTQLGLAWPAEWEQISTARLYQHYQMWCETAGLKGVSRRKFSTQIKNLGYTVRRHVVEGEGCVETWQGIKLKAENVVISSG